MGMYAGSPLAYIRTSTTANKGSSRLDRQRHSLKARRQTCSGQLPPTHLTKLHIKTGARGSIPSTRTRIMFSPNRPDFIWHPHSLLFKGYREKSGRNVNVNTHST